ncbi:hypothetical protein A1D31_14250 [Bradyrhizobium liaoningense]|nr:hypothetical protein A1D31_14250 [Bradyrhizobium liaoningense]
MDYQWVAIQIVLFGGCFGVAVAMATLCHRAFRIDVAPSGRNSHLDGLRALAALAVVACHTNQSLVSFFGYAKTPAAGNQLGLLGVKLFFALTAYLFTAQALAGRLEPIPFLIGRFRRIMPLYFAAATTAVLFSFLYYVEPMPPIGEWLVELSRLYTYPFFRYETLTLKGHPALELIGIAWTLSYEWRFYLFLVPACLIFRASRVAAAIILPVVIVMAIQKDDNTVWTFFISGTVAAFIERHIPAISPVASRVIVAAVPALAIVAILQPGSGFTGPDAFLSGAIFMAVLFAKPRALEWAPFQLLGRISYSVYLLQYLVLFRVVNIGFANGVTEASPIWKFATAWAAVAILVPISCATYKWIELPFMSQRRPASARPITATDYASG